MRHLSANIRVAKSGDVNSFTGPPLNDLRILNAGPSQYEVEYSAINVDRPWQSCVSSGLDLSDGNCRFCLAASELLPPQSRLLFFDGVLSRDVREPGPLVDLAAPVGILHGPRKWMLAGITPPVASSLPVVLYENETSRIDLPHH